MPVSTQFHLSHVMNIPTTQAICITAAKWIALVADTCNCMELLIKRRLVTRPAELPLITYHVYQMTVVVFPSPLLAS